MQRRVEVRVEVGVKYTNMDLIQAEGDHSVWIPQFTDTGA